MRTITAPGVEIKEIDKSQYSPVMTGTACYIMGFSDKGEPYVPMEFTSRSAFQSYYGDPDNEAERYFYNAAVEVLDQNGRLYTARLPYDNKAFEKMVGVKYKVQTKKKLEDTCFKALAEEDKELKNVAKITCGSIPTLYDLSAIDEYRTDEAKVPAGTFLIVDTTGATYGKVIEDERKGQKREVIGIIPVVTTAANALYAQSLLTEAAPTLANISSFEVIAGTSLKTLVASENGTTMVIDGIEMANDGLSNTDVVVPFNTTGLFTNELSTVTTGIVQVQTLVDFDGLAKITDKDSMLAWFKNSTAYNDCELDYDSIISTEATLENGLLELVYNGTIEDTDGNTKYWDKDLTTKKWYVNEYDAAGNFVDFSGLSDYIIENAEIDVDSSTENCYVYKLTSDIKCDVGRKTYKSGEIFAQYTQTDTQNAAVYHRIYSDNLNTHAVWQATYKKVVTTTGDEWHGINGDDSIPDTLALDANNYFSTIVPAADGEGFDPEHLKDIGVCVYKAYLDPSEGNKVSYELVEAYCGSLYKDDKDPNTGVSKFIDTIVNTNSEYINFFSNCFNSKNEKKWYLEECDMLVAEPSEGVVLGLYSAMTKEEISVTKSIYDGMNKCFEKVSDINERDIDIVCDAGISNIASFLKAIFHDKGTYDMSLTDDLGNSLLSRWKCVRSTDVGVKTWKTVVQKLDTFCKKVRKDCMFITECPRPLVIQGQKKIIRESKPTNTIDANILPYVKAVTGLNTSYGAGYIDWFEIADEFTGDFFWLPPSIKAMGVYINTDVNFQYWDAPAGLNRGVIAATDVAFSPTVKQAGAIYEKNWNYAINYPQDGIVLEGQKTFQVKPSAFDRVNVRRLFLRLERAAYKVARYFVYEGNTAYTRQRLVDALDPYFKEAKVKNGIYDYKIICDESINDPVTIDRNELKVKIGIKPVKTAEFILIDFIAVSTGGSFEEAMA